MPRQSQRAAVRAPAACATRRRLRLNPIAAVCAGLLSASALAQTAPATEQKLDTVTVTGFRASLESSISTKRNADAIVEATETGSTLRSSKCS